MLEGRAVLVTGGTGSFGRAFVRRALWKHRPSRLVVFSRDEQKQFQMAQELPPDKHPELRYFIGDVRDPERLKRAMEGIDTVVHAAAMKHVPIAEYNPFECIRTNVGGAENVINAAIECGIEKVIALSTDKAANPINLYGATKLAADKCFVAANHLSASSKTRFSVVRYGNVLGSRGSVVEHFQRLVDSGVRELPITDRQMTRFWITLRRGVDFVIERLGSMRGGEIFVPKLPSSSIEELVGWLWPQCQTVEVGIRPGEKLHEVLIPYDEARNTLEYERHFMIGPSFSWWKQREELAQGETGRHVRADFKYRSKENDWWLTKEELVRMLEEDV